MNSDITFEVDDLAVCPGCATVLAPPNEDYECPHCHYQGDFCEVNA